MDIHFLEHLYFFWILGIKKKHIPVTEKVYEFEIGPMKLLNNNFLIILINIGQL